MIVESNLDIEWMISKLNQLIVDLKKQNPKSRLLSDALLFYESVVAPWYERYKFLKEESEGYEDEKMKNRILDLSNRIVKHLKKSDKNQK